MCCEAFEGFRVGRVDILKRERDKEKLGDLEM